MACPLTSLRCRGGGKKRIKAKCVSSFPGVFTNSGFDHAWSEASTQGRLSIYDKDKYKTLALKW